MPAESRSEAAAPPAHRQGRDRAWWKTNSHGLACSRTVRVPWTAADWGWGAGVGAPPCGGLPGLRGDPAAAAPGPTMAPPLAWTASAHARGGSQGHQFLRPQSGAGSGHQGRAWCRRPRPAVLPAPQHASTVPTRARLPGDLPAVPVAAGPGRCRARHPAWGGCPRDFRRNGTRLSDLAMSRRSTRVGPPHGGPHPQRGLIVPGTHARPATLRDGTRVRFRVIRPQDKARLLEVFERVSPDSRYRRFLAPVQACPRSRCAAAASPNSSTTRPGWLSSRTSRPALAGVGRWIPVAVRSGAGRDRRGGDRCPPRAETRHHILWAARRVRRRQNVRAFGARVLDDNQPMRSILSAFGPASLRLVGIFSVPPLDPAAAPAQHRANFPGRRRWLCLSPHPR